LINLVYNINYFTFITLKKSRAMQNMVFMPKKAHLLKMR